MERDLEKTPERKIVDGETQRLKPLLVIFVTKKEISFSAVTHSVVLVPKCQILRTKRVASADLCSGLKQNK